MHLRINELSSAIIGAAIEVHRTLGPGLLEALLPIHQAQLLSYLKLGGWKLGLLINFHAPLLREGIKRVVLGLEQVPKSMTVSNG
jgi:hypothetical protein